MRAIAYRRSRGVALITAMLIAALATAGAVALASSQQFSTRRISNIVSADRADLALAGLERSASVLLQQNRSRGHYDSLGQPWAETAIEETQEDLALQGRLSDLQGRFNLTNLSAEPRYAAGGGRADAQGEAGSEPANDSSTSGATNAAVPAEAEPTAATLGGAAPDLPAATNGGGGSTDAANAILPGATRLYRRTGVTAAATQAAVAAAVGAPADQGSAASMAGPVGTAGRGVFPVAAADGAPADTAAGASNTASGAPAGARGSTQSPQQLAEQQLRHLYRVLQLDPSGIEAILDWIDPDTDTRFPNGAEDEYYTGLHPAYRAANRPFVTTRELLLVKGMTLEIYRKLAPYIVTLPQATPLNVNTAPKEVLMSLSAGLDSGAVETILRVREAQPFQSAAMFLQHPLLQFRGVPSQLVTVDSSYFELHTTVRGERLDFATDSLLARRGQTVRTLRRWRSDFDD